jgi:acyl carrier protein
VTFVEDEYSIAVADDDMIPQNFDSIDALVAFVAKKRS